MKRLQKMVALGKKLRKIRKQMRLSQSEVAKKVGCSSSLVSTIECGTRLDTEIVLSTVEKICKVIDLSFFEIKKEFDLLTKREKAKVAALEKSITVRGKVFVLLRETDQRRYYTGSRVEQIEHSNKTHKLYRFTADLREAVKFKSVAKANEIASKLQNVVVKEYDECLRIENKLLLEQNGL